MGHIIVQVQDKSEPTNNITGGNNQTTVVIFQIKSPWELLS